MEAPHSQRFTWRC